MITVGVDLAAEPKKSAVAVIEWRDTAAVVSELQLGATDADIVALSVGAVKVGVDCPFGWPDEFVDFVVAQSRGDIQPRTLAGLEWRRRLAYRDTDRFVREQTGRWPLSVSTDRLGLTAMRCVELLAEFGAAGTIVDRSGEGALVEVYPGAALRVWGVAVDGYKTDVPSRAAATENLRSVTPWLELLPAHVRLMSRSDDAFDAVVAALVARASALGLTHGIPDGSSERARTEGWMALPTHPLGDLR